MPVYEYYCSKCDSTTDHVVPYAKRKTRQICGRCGKKVASYQVSTPIIGAERKRGDSRIIRDERQVTSEHGDNWRDKGTTGKPGGAGSRLYFHD